MFMQCKYLLTAQYYILLLFLNIQYRRDWYMQCDFLLFSYRFI